MKRRTGFTLIELLVVIAIIAILAAILFPVFAQALFKTFDLTDAKREQYGGSGTRHVSLDACTNHAHSLQFLLTQRECLQSHRVTFSRCC